ncbi:MAG: type IV pilus modification protein PilV [Gammaproteobacteria bacterium]
MKRQHGFSLLEALIALVIVSIGLLGVAGIIANSLRVNQGAQIRSQASWLAHDIIDSMRANRAHAQEGKYDLDDCESAGGAGEAVVDGDLEAWCASLSTTLPGGTGAVATSAAGVVTVTIQWDDTRAGGSADQQFVMETRL